MFRNFLNTILIYLFVFLGTAVAFNHFIQKGFGRSDFTPFLILSIPSILINSLLLILINRYLNRKSMKIILLFKLLTFFILPFAGIYSYIIFLGPWFGALSIRPFPAHLAAVFVILLLENETKKKKIIKNGFFGLASIFFFGILLSPMIKKFNIIFLGGGTIPFTASFQLKKEMTEQEIIKHYCPRSNLTSKELKVANPKPHIFKKKIPSPHRLMKGYFCQIDALQFLIDFYKATGIISNMPTWSWPADFDEPRSSILFLYSDKYISPKSSASLGIPKEGSIIYYDDKGQWKHFPEKVSFIRKKFLLSYRIYHRDNGGKQLMLCYKVVGLFASSRGKTCKGIFPEEVELSLKTM